MAHPQTRSTPTTYADYRARSGDDYFELIEGVAYAMAPAPTILHQQLAGEIYRQIANELRNAPCRPFIAPVDVLFPQGDETTDQVRTVLQPDVFVVCDPARIGARAIIGAPDWVVEVLSPGSASRDHIAKRRIYENGGVREYWLVHPEDRIVMIYRLERDGYGKPDVQPLEGETAVGILPGVVIRWEEGTLNEHSG